MTRTFLQVIGVLTVLGILAAGFASAFFVRERFVVTVQSESSRAKAGPDPVALLRDDVGSLRRDVAALAKALSANFQTLSDRGDESEGDRAKALDAALAPLRASVASLTERAAALDGAVATRLDALRRDQAAALEDLRGRVDALGAPRAAVAPATPSVATGPASPPPARATVPPAATAGPPAGPEAGTPPPTATATPPATPPAPATATPPAGKRRPFLSFSLPSESLDLDKPTNFEIVPSLSRVGFDGKSTLHDFSGTTSDVSGTFVARLAQPGTGTTGTITAGTASLDTGIVERNADMVALLEVKQFPSITLSIASFAPSAGDPKTGAWTGTVHGTMTIRGVAREVALPVSVTVDESRRVVVKGEAPLLLRDYGITPPTKAGVISMDNQVKVWFTVRARAVGAAQ